MDAEIRTLREAEFDSFWRMLASSFGEEARPDDRETYRRIFDTDRALVAAEGESIVAAAVSTPFQLTVPGGETVACAGVTGVGTLPTHRRRGLSRALMRRQLEDVHERGEPVAYLWASEAAIYQRYGYGVGALSATFRIRREGTAFTRPIEVPGRIRLIERDEALKLIPDVYERARQGRPGMIDRSPAWQGHRFEDQERHREGASPYFFAIHETGEGVQGYVVYRIKDTWTHAGPNQELEIEELLTTTDDAYAALWKYCFEIDLVRTVKGWKRPADEPLLHMLAEPRALRFQVRDGTWLRLVDVARALEARRYSHEGRLVLEIRDETAPWNDGTYELDGGPDGATCQPSGAAPDLSMRVEDLAAAYLGAVSLPALASAGRVTELTEGALVNAEATFSSKVAPWCPWVF